MRCTAKILGRQIRPCDRKGHQIPPAQCGKLVVKLQAASATKLNIFAFLRIAYVIDSGAQPN
jgi:hypothetical protein